MPRSRGGSGGRSSARAPTRPTAPSTAKRPAAMPSQQQDRRVSTAANPPNGAQPAPGQQGKSSGIFGQMVSTAAGVAVGSTIGHTIAGMIGGSAPAEQQQAETSASQGNESVYQNASDKWGPRSCENDAKTFTKCLDENQGNMQICGWYLEQLKACQSAASQY